MILEYYVDYLEVVLVAYCKHCGSKFVPVQNVCTQYGTHVINGFKQSPSLRNNKKIHITIKIFKEIEDYTTKKIQDIVNR